MSLIVAKLGGSLAGSPQRDAWLAALVASTRRLVLVTGGGPFAGAVRAAQAAMGFDEAIAHRLALLAMEQYAIVIAARQDRFALAATRDDIAAALARNRIPVWLPSAMALAAAEIPQSWDMTSDSLAAWLAGELAAAQLLLIKSSNVEEPASARGLAGDGVVDPLFPHFAARSRASVFFAGPACLHHARERFSSGATPGVGIACEAIGAAPAAA
ncbi:aspartate/glutamate/uridylate kinase [Methylocella silvestris BL2]|uniref:Aspartate/glutamate/uridylate kinase n=1 Tax=Methylocella silvestris (strain DSM 15510 / CIP 108128 / LMG 27833 / NCIMB 13906 / BL2) TaxID=395965 RepID=B8EKF5_METSB|nr:aspartate/glutamate/uridylate kinase [Methylocella silvestris]ACK51325.1 aspartate/glutamate/uridylate kinase [Methylocella silvestris BL2]